MYKNHGTSRVLYHKCLGCKKVEMEDGSWELAKENIDLLCSQGWWLASTMCNCFEEWCKENNTDYERFKNKFGANK